MGEDRQQRYRDMVPRLTILTRLRGPLICGINTRNDAKQQVGWVLTCSVPIVVVFDHRNQPHQAENAGTANVSSPTCEVDGGDTDTEPSEKMPITDILWIVDICNLHVAGIGRIRITKSVHVLMAEPMTKKSHASMQTPCTLLSQINRMGRHCNAQTTKTIIAQHVVKAPSPYAKWRKYLIFPKMRT